MRSAKVHGWLWALLLLLSACIGQDSWYRWASVHPDPTLAPMHRMRLVVEDGWRSMGSAQSDAYRAALVDALARRGIALDDDADSVDATLVVQPWYQRAHGRGGRGGTAGNSSVGVDIRIDRAGDHQRMFSGRFIGAPAAAANAIADLVEHGRVDET